MIFNDNTVENAASALAQLLQTKLDTIGYDKTMVYTIADDSQKDKGQYKVSDGSVTFDVYSETTTYKKDEKVYVTIPQGDFREKKVILGKYIEAEEALKDIGYISPNDRIVPIHTVQNSLLGSDNKTTLKLSPSDDKLEVYGQLQKIELTGENKHWTFVEKNLTRLAVKVGIKSSLSDFNIISGEYGLRVILFAKQGKIEENSQLEATTVTGILSEAKEKGYEVQVLEFSSSNMIGNIYNYKGIIEQSYIYDISNMGNIVYYIPMVYHKKDFKSKTLTGIVDLSTISAAQNATIEFYNLDLSFGYGQEEFSKEDNLLLFTHPEEDLFYSSGVEAKKILYCHNIKLNQKTLKYEYVLPADLNKTLEDYSIISQYEWYESTTQMNDDSRLGFGWGPIGYSNSNIFEINFTLNEPSKKYKVLKVIQEERKISGVDGELSKTESFIESNEIIFSNTDFSQNTSGQAHIEILDEQKDFIGLYQDNYKIINYEDFLKTRTLKVTIPSTRVYDTIQINWYIPKDGTMLQDVFINEKVNSKYSLYSDKNTSYQVQDDGGYYIITKIGKNGETDFEKFFRQSFAIAEYYQPAFLRNQVSCKIYYDNNFDYCDEGFLSLLFGSSNANGSVYNFGMYFVDSNSPYFLIDDDNSYVNVKCFLTSNTVEITEEDLTALEGASVTSINSFLSVSSQKDENGQTFYQIKKTGSGLTYDCGVLKATVKIQGQNLTTYLSIPGRRLVKDNSGKITTEIKGMSGTTHISYNSFGSNLNNVIYPLKLYGKGATSTAQEEQTKTVYQQLPKTRRLMDQSKGQSLASFLTDDGSINFIPSKCIYKFKIQSENSKVVFDETKLTEGLILTVVSKIDHVKIEKPNDIHSLESSYWYRHQCMIVKNTNNALECVFINRRGYDFSPANLINNSCYFYLHGADYQYSHTLDGKTVTDMPFQIIFTQGSDFIPYVCAKRKIDKNEDSLLKNPVILTSSKAKRFYTVESRFDTPIAENNKGDFVLPHWRVALDIGNQKKCYIYKLKTLGTDKEIIDIWEDYIIKFLPGKDIVPENSVLYLDDNTGGKNAISPSLLADQLNLESEHYLQAYSHSEFSQNNIEAYGCNYVKDKELNKVVIKHNTINISNYNSIFMVESSFSSYIYKIKPGEEIPVNWRLLSVSKNEASISIIDITSKPSVGCPLIKQDSVDNKTTWFLQPYPLYEEKSALESSFYVLQAISGDLVLWSQPVTILQNRYEFEILNKWDGTATEITEGSIMSPCIGAGSKNGENQFSGVLMGKIGTSSNDTNPVHGLYGFSDGAQAFGFKEDGTAFIGKSGAGRINFDGNNGTITSFGYGDNGLEYINEKNETVKLGSTGLKIDLDDPSLNMDYDGKSLIDFRPKDNTMILNSSNTYESEDSEGKAISLPNFSLDLNEGALKAINFSLYGGDNDFIQGESGRGISINSQVNGKPALFVGYNENASNLPFKYPNFQVNWNGDLTSTSLNLYGAEIKDSSLSFQQQYQFTPSDKVIFNGDLEMCRIQFKSGTTYGGESYIMYFNMLYDNDKTNQEKFFIDIRPDFSNTTDINYYKSLPQKEFNGKNYAIPNMIWRLSEEPLTDYYWASAKIGDKFQLGKDTIKFNDFTASNCDITSRNVTGIYLRFQSIEIGENHLGFAANLLSSGWAIFGEGTKDDSLANQYASTLIGQLAGMTDYTTSFKLSGIKHLADKFIDIQVTRLSDKSKNVFEQQPDKIKTAGFYIDAFGETYISDLKIGQRDDNNKLSYVSLLQYIKENLLEKCKEKNGYVQYSDGTYTCKYLGTKESISLGQAVCLAFAAESSSMIT